jgi:hypothetical protein
VVLLGSNAIYPDGVFVHSMGHFTVTAAAKTSRLTARCDVIVLTDSTKIGFYHNNRPPRERHRDRWLTHKKDVVDSLKQAGVELHNWQEDTVPMELIDKLVVLDGAKLLSKDSASITKARFDAPQIYCSTLKVRLLASYLSFMRLMNWLPEEVRREIEDKKKLKDKEDVNLGNWRVAEAYVMKTSLPQRVREWIDNAWHRQAGPEIKRLEQAINDDYRALVEKRRPRRDDEAEPQTAQVIDIADPRLPVAGDTVPAAMPPEDDEGLVQPSPSA